MTLLKLKQDASKPVLPIGAAVRTIAVVGSEANSSHLSIDRYTGRPDAAHITTFLQGIAARAGQKVKIVTCENSLPSCADYLRKTYSLDLLLVATTGHAEGEQHDRAALGLKVAELKLLQALHAQLPAVPKVLVVVAGGAVDTSSAEPMVAASIWAGKGGMQGEDDAVAAPVAARVAPPAAAARAARADVSPQAGAGLASLLFGDREFTGRISQTVYKDAWTKAVEFTHTQISGDGAGPGRGYRYNIKPELVQYAFGHGLSYHRYRTKFAHPNYKISAAELTAGETVSIGASLTLSPSLSGGAAAPAEGARSVLLFIAANTEAMSLGLPVRKQWLGAFDKLQSIPVPAEPTAQTTADLTLKLGADALSRWVPASGDPASQQMTEGKYMLAKGKYTLRLSDGAATATLELV